MSKDEFLKIVNKSKAVIEKNKKWIMIGAVILTVSFTSTAVLLKRCYTVEIDNKVVALVNSKNQVEKIIDKILKDSKITSGLNIITPSKISYKEVFAFGKKITPVSNIENTLEDNLELMAEAYSINVNGNDIAYLKDKKAAENVLTQVKEACLKNSKDIGQAGVDFLESVKVLKSNTDIGNVKDEKSVFDLIMDSTVDIKEYTIQEGDTISQIAEKYKVKQSDIKRMNPGIDMDKIQIGQKINLSVPKYLLNVVSTETKTYKENIPYDIKHENTSDLYKGQTKVKTEGKEGIKSVTAEIIKVNGIMSEEKVVKEEVIQEPQSKLVLNGTKNRPSTLAYGIFTNPSRGSITSRFGRRWGGQHTGIDIGVSSGTSVKAADGGKVIFSGWKGNYGKLVIIDHENGYTTYYGHNSSLKVKVGQRVARGEVIAASGATGNVTGPHLHFEIRKNGVPQNPLKYVKY